MPNKIIHNTCQNFRDDIFEATATRELWPQLCHTAAFVEISKILTIRVSLGTHCSAFLQHYVENISSDK